METANTPDAESDNGSPWKSAGEFSWNHPSGWTITRYSVKGARTYLLWDKEGGKYGPFRSAKEAQAEFDRRAPTTTGPATDETVSEDDNEQPRADT